jgi:hypothetical protein
MNRGFKTEEAVELTLNPQLHYDLIGSNNPDAALNNSRLNIPRIGSADDCSVLLQVERGRFTHEDFVGCLSKETKGVLKTKLEEIPVTAQQRVGILAFLTVVVLVGVLGFKGLDVLLGKTSEPSAAEISKRAERLQGWQVPEIYEDNRLYEDLKSGKIQITVGKPTVKNSVASFPLSVVNQSNGPITFTAYTSGAAPQDRLPFDQKRISSKLLFPSVSAEYKLMAAIGKEKNERQVLLDVYLEGSSGESLAGKRMIPIE